MPPVWDPERYLEFADFRRRPAADLLARVPADAPRVVVDLGCGPGTATRLLHARWPGARVIGVDRSAEMLAVAERAAATDAAIDWEQVAIEAWAPRHPPDVIFSNAALHWVPDHARFFPHLVSLLAGDGVLAVQMPHRVGRQPYVETLHEIAHSGPWRDRLADLAAASRARPTPQQYYEWLAPHVRSSDIWVTEYLHVLAGEDPVYRWTSSAAQQPFVQRLHPSEIPVFTEAYRQRLREVYPMRQDGTTVFPFVRLFIVATRGGH